MITLSIGMIVKNEEKHLQNCLESMKPILDSLDCELIVFDTGSTDETVNIAKKFTSHVHEIEWRGDFAWARNQTLDIATGEWYMYVDADEVFTDVSDLIAFFATGEYKDFGCANYRWRNILEENKFSYTRPIRLYKRSEKARFVGKIHEQIPYHHPMKNLDTIADHYGYYRQGEEGEANKKAKHERNISALLEMHQEDPSDLRTIYHIIREYFGVSNDEVIKYINLGLETTGKNHKELYYHVFKCGLVEYHHLQQDFEKVAAVAREYINELKVTHHGMLRVLSLEANAHSKMELHIEAAKASLQAFEAFLLYKNKKMDVDIEVVLPVDSDTLRGSPFYLGRLLEDCTRAGDPENAAGIITSYASTSSPPEIITICEELVNNECAEPKLIALVAALALTRMAESRDYTAAVDIHEVAVRLAHKYMLQSLARYEDGTTDTPTIIGEYIFHAGNAYEARDRGDLLGYVRGLRQAFHFNPAMKDVILLCLEQVRE
ncbi:MAG: glycosyltransferase family 2 protein [Defluviitaleaceae bacterium]|nr:glycosyltransferase family 2 protein [Defluviitaleaceae bacterium]